eukprot:2018811-Pleurochrysis_carterae.AAC.2
MKSSILLGAGHQFPTGGVDCRVVPYCRRRGDGLRNGSRVHIGSRIRWAAGRRADLVDEAGLGAG